MAQIAGRYKLRQIKSAENRYLKNVRDGQTRDWLSRLDLASDVQTRSSAMASARAAEISPVECAFPRLSMKSCLKLMIPLQIYSWIVAPKICTDVTELLHDNYILTCWLIRPFPRWRMTVMVMFGLKDGYVYKIRDLYCAIS